VEGLLHVSEMADIRPDHPQSLVSPGDLLLLRVIRVEPERRRIGLSLRQVSETEWAEWAASYREKHAQALEAQVALEEAEALEAEAEEAELAAEDLEAAAAVEAVVVEDLELEAETAATAAADLEAEAAAEVALAEALVADAQEKLAVASVLETEAEEASQEAEELAADVEAKIVAASDLKAEAEEAVEEAGALAVAADMENEGTAEDAALTASLDLPSGEAIETDRAADGVADSIEEASELTGPA